MGPLGGLAHFRASPLLASCPDTIFLFCVIVAAKWHDGRLETMIICFNFVLSLSFELVASGLTPA